jgi:hypothetical protein
MAETRLTGNWFLSIKIYTLHDHPDGFDKSKPFGEYILIKIAYGINGANTPKPFY